MSIRYSAQERAAIVRKYAGSGMTLEGFSRWSGLRVSRLEDWLAAARSPEEATWVEVQWRAADEPVGPEGLSC